MIFPYCRNCQSRFVPGRLSDSLSSTGFPLMSMALPPFLLQIIRLPIFFKKCLLFELSLVIIYKHVERTLFSVYNHGSLVKRLRRRPLTAETAVRFRYELREVLRTQTKQRLGRMLAFVFKSLFLSVGRSPAMK